MTFFLILATSIGLTQALFGAGKEQAVAVKGRLLCNGEPAVDIQVRLFDEDILFDAKLGEMRTNHTGHFEIAGTGREITTIDPYVMIYHDCENHKLTGRRNLQVWIPERYVNEGKVALKTYDFRELELSGIFKEYCPECPSCSTTTSTCHNHVQSNDRNL